MKKIIAILLACALGSSLYAQTDASKQTKVKKTSNLGEKVHNTFSRHKHYNGYKVKTTKDVNGREVKEKKKVKE